MSVNLDSPAAIAWVDVAEVPAELESLSKALAALAHPARLRILRALLATEGCFCGDLVPLVGLAQSTVSHHLKTLREAGLVTACESGTYVSYCVDRARLAAVQRALARALG